MFTPRRLYASSFLFLCLLSTGLAQSDQPGSVRQKASQTNSTVTASAAAERVRFTALSNVVRIQLQVISESGQILFDVSSKGNVLDWSLQDSSGQRLQGSYLAVVTVKSLSGRLSERIGSVSVQEKQVELKPVEATGLTTAQQQAVGPIEEQGALTILNGDEQQAVTVVANNGGDGQIIRDRGALSFRLGNFFSGKDNEQMRLTEEGNLGIGTDNPRTKLDVAGDISARGTVRADKVEFADGTVQTSGLSGRKLADGTLSPNATGTGTQNQIAKWIDGLGTLGDSTITEASGNVGIGTASPASLLHLAGPSGVSAITLNTPGSQKFRFQTVPGILNWGALTLNANYNSGWFLDEAATNGWFFKLDTRGGNADGPNNGLWLFRIPAGPNPHTDEGPVFGVSSSRAYFAGNVGIGNTAPGAKLDVTGNINTSTQYNILGSRVLSTPGADNVFAGVEAGKNNTSGTQNAFFGRLAGSTNTTGELNSFFGKHAGTGSTMGTGNSFFGFAAGGGNVDGSGNTAIGYSAILGSGSLINATAIGAQAKVNQSNSLVLGSISGVNSASANTNVGIGITAPSATLHVVAYTSSSGENTVTFQAPNIGSNQSHIHYGTNGDWFIRSASAAGKVILQDTVGNVGIGTGSPAAKLDVRDGTGASGSGGHVQIGAPISSADAKIIVFGNSGCGADVGPCVSIGEQDDVHRMVLRANDFRFRKTGVFSGGDVLPDSDNLQNLGSSANRWSAVFAANGTIQTSDVRLKRGITNLKYGLNQVMQLRPVSFQWKNGNDKRTHLGLIAQEVDAVMPEAVQKGADASAPLGMNYSDLIPVLIKAIQEQQGTLERAQAEIKTLRAENEALSRRIISIETTSTVATSTKKAQ